MLRSNLALKLFIWVREIVNKEELAKKSGKVSHNFDSAMTFNIMTLNIFDLIPTINNNDTRTSNE